MGKYYGIDHSERFSGAGDNEFSSFANNSSNRYAREMFEEFYEERLNARRRTRNYEDYED